MDGWGATWKTQLVLQIESLLFENVVIPILGEIVKT
jgi:hypothetical protein